MGGAGGNSICGTGFGKTIDRRPEARTPKPGVCNWRVDTVLSPQELFRSFEDDDDSMS